jgi:hypothetical protein
MRNSTSRFGGSSFWGKVEQGKIKFCFAKGKTPQFLIPNSRKKQPSSTRRKDDT